MAKHRAQRNYFLTGCTLSLLAIFGVLSLFLVNHLNKPKVMASVATPTTLNFDAAELRTWVAARGATVAAQEDAQRQEAAAQAAARRAAAEKAAEEKVAAEKAAAAKEAAAKAAADAAAAQKTTAAPASPSPVPAVQGTGVAAYQAYAAGKVSASEYNCLVPMWNRESGWNPNAQNPTSTAYGIAQFLDSTWALTGYAKTSDPYTQIDAGIVYVNKAYGGACNAWSFWQAHNYY